MFEIGPTQPDLFSNAARNLESSFICKLDLLYGLTTRSGLMPEIPKKLDISAIQAAFDCFAEVGQLAVLQELKIRLLADKTKAIQESAYAFTVAETEDAVVKYFYDKDMISMAESQLIKTTRKIRNKILHCEFDSAIKHIEKLVGPLPGPSVTMVKLPENSSGEGILNAIFEGISKPRKVSEVSLKEAGLFGWLLDVTQRGGFKAAIEQFQRAISVINRLINETAKLDFEAAQK